MAESAHYALILESFAEINAHLRVLDEANARLEAAAERQLELLEFLVARQEHNTRQRIVRDSPQADSDPRRMDVEANRIIDSGHEYARETHPALFKVVDLLEQDERARTLSVRQLAQQTGVSKSWCAIAKRHVLRGKSVH